VTAPLAGESTLEGSVGGRREPLDCILERQRGDVWISHLHGRFRDKDTPVARSAADTTVMLAFHPPRSEAQAPRPRFSFCSERMRRARWNQWVADDEARQASEASEASAMIAGGPAVAKKIVDSIRFRSSTNP
jgi:hypothetical protein